MENINKIEDKNVKLVSIALDNPRKLSELKERYKLSFQIISDRSGTITKAFNVLLTEKHSDHDQIQINNAIPSLFLINQEGIIVWQYVGTKTDRPSIATIIKAIDENLK